MGCLWDLLGNCWPELLNANSPLARLRERKKSWRVSARQSCARAARLWTVNSALVCSAAVNLFRSVLLGEPIQKELLNRLVFGADHVAHGVACSQVAKLFRHILDVIAGAL